MSGSLEDRIQKSIDTKTKPLGSLGQLETLAHRIATIQGTTTPSLTNPALLVFAGDHGITDEGVSAYPREVTYQMVYNYLSGGAAVNVFARQHQLNLQVVDAGVAHDFGEQPGLMQHKIAMGTANFRHQTAMTSAQYQQCLDQGERIVAQLADQGCNALAFGEMGIGNTSSAAVLMSLFCNQPIDVCTGRGTGLDDAALHHKTEVLRQAIAHHGTLDSPRDVLTTFGGFELVMMCGAMLAAHRRKMVLLIDGFIVTAALLGAIALEPEVRSSCIFAHCSQEQGHRLMLEHLKAEPLLHLDLRLGEGTGAALAWPLLESAVRFLNEMATFADAGVSERDA